MKYINKINVLQCSFYHITGALPGFGETAQCATVVVHNPARPDRVTARSTATRMLRFKPCIFIKRMSCSLSLAQ
jgi:hypothetical protein